MMATGYLIRDQILKTCIRGVLVIEGVLLYTLELPWDDNKNDISCIPAGEYDVAFIKSSPSGKYKNVYQVLNVPNRGGILIHHGNTVECTHGCILIGVNRTTMAGKPAVSNTRTAVELLSQHLAKEPFRLKIIGDQKLKEVA